MALPAPIVSSEYAWYLITNPDMGIRGDNESNRRNTAYLAKGTWAYVQEFSCLWNVVVSSNTCWAAEVIDVQSQKALQLLNVIHQTAETCPARVGLGQEWMALVPRRRGEVCRSAGVAAGMASSASFLQRHSGARVVTEAGRRPSL